LALNYGLEDLNETKWFNQRRFAFVGDSIVFTYVCGRANEKSEA